MSDATPQMRPKECRRGAHVGPRVAEAEGPARRPEITEYKCTICGEWREAARPTMTFGPACRSAMSRYGWEDARRRAQARKEQ